MNQNFHNQLKINDNNTQIRIRTNILSNFLPKVLPLLHVAIGEASAEIEQSPPE